MTTMNHDRALAARCIAEIDAVRAGVRFCDAGWVALAQTPEKRHPGFDKWLSQHQFHLRCFLDDLAEAPLDLHAFAAQVSWLLASYRKDAKAIRFIIWVMGAVLRVSVPMQPPREVECESDDASESGSAGWIFLLAAVALWLATTH